MHNDEANDFTSGIQTALRQWRGGDTAETITEGASDAAEGQGRKAVARVILGWCDEAEALARACGFSRAQAARVVEGILQAL